MRVPGNDGPVAVVVHAGLGEGQLERVRAHLDALDAGVLFDWNTILVPESLIKNCKQRNSAIEDHRSIHVFPKVILIYVTSFSSTSYC